MEHVIGIDFGTTKTLVSYYDQECQTNGYVRLGRGIDKMPTSVFVDEHGVWQFGDDADDFMSQYPSRYRRDFKLWLGKSSPYLVTKVNGKIQQFTAKDLVAKFLQNIKVQCEETVFHEPVTSCIVTYPVAFSIAQREELKDAARDAGFEDIRLLPEPEAAGYAYYKFGVDKRLSKMMVVDWGGGTVDFAMVSFEGGAVSLVPESYGGEENVGGRKFDELLFTHLSRKIEQSGGSSLEDDGDPQLNKHVCNCKEKLSRVTPVKQVMLGGKGVYRTEVGREEFNGVIAPVVDRVVDRLKGLLAGCAQKPEALLLIGGSSSVPFVRERLEEATGLKCVAWDKLNEAVAIGAAWYGSKRICSVDCSIRTDGSNGGVASGVDLALPNVERRCWKAGAELESFIREQKAKHEDVWYFLRSTVIAQWRLNPVLSSALALGDELAKITENDDSKVLSIRVRQGLGTVALGEFDAIVKAAAESVGDLVEECLRADEAFVDLYPGLKSASVEREKINVQSFKEDVERQLRQLKDVYNDIFKKYKMLCDGYARYDKIMAGGSFWKNAILGGALGWLTGGLGVIAAVAWGGWENMNNKDFVQNYSNAIQDFLSTCDAFTDQGQKLLSQMAMSKQDLWGRAFAREEVYLRTLNAEGVDLTEVERRLEEKDRQEFQNAQKQNPIEVNQMAALAVQLLKQDAPISENRIQKIVEKLRKDGALLFADGTLDEEALQALVPVDKGKEESAAEFWKIARRGEGCDGFYVGDRIPQSKLINALREYAVGLQPEDVFCLFDSTFFGSGDNGFVIAPGGVCWKQFCCDSQACTWNEMKTISANDRSENGSTISINGVEVDVPRGHVRKFENMVKSLRALMTGGAEALEIVDNVDGNKSSDGPAKIIKCPNCGATVSKSSQCCWSCDAPIPRITEC